MKNKRNYLIAFIFFIGIIVAIPLSFSDGPQKGKFPKPPPPPPVCGNRLIEGPENCEVGFDKKFNTGDDQTKGKDCHAVDSRYDGGYPMCNPGCMSLDFTNCTDCGNGIAEGNEMCDGFDLKGKTCEALGHVGGRLNCTSDTASEKCVFDESECHDCGDGICGNGEDVANCPQDCGCNRNKICEQARKEVFANCPDDCPLQSALHFFEARTTDEHIPMPAYEYEKDKVKTIAEATIGVPFEGLDHYGYIELQSNPTSVWVSSSFGAEKDFRNYISILPEADALSIFNGRNPIPLSELVVAQLEYLYRQNHPDTPLPDFGVERDADGNVLLDSDQNPIPSLEPNEYREGCKAWFLPERYNKFTDPSRLLLNLSCPEVRENMESILVTYANSLGSNKLYIDNLLMKYYRFVYRLSQYLPGASDDEKLANLAGKYNEILGFLKGQRPDLELIVNSLYQRDPISRNFEEYLDPTVIDGYLNEFAPEFSQGSIVLPALDSDEGRWIQNYAQQGKKLFLMFAPVDDASAKALYEWAHLMQNPNLWVEFNDQIGGAMKEYPFYYDHYGLPTSPLIQIDLNTYERHYQEGKFIFSRPDASSLFEIKFVAHDKSSGKGDMNHDGVVNSDDIALFVAALNGSATDPDILWRADCDSSGSVDGFDIDPFIALLGG